MNQPGSSIRIGGVPYRVGAPLLVGLEDEPGVELVNDAPARLVEPLRAGLLDVGLVSSIEAFRRPGYRLVPEIGICCRGPVHSVRAFCRPGKSPGGAGPGSSVPGRIETVGLDSASESSVALVQILLRERWGQTDFTVERIESTRTPDRLPHDLVMLIGDHGLYADPGEREVIDLGGEWHDWTGLPFVFALWMIAPGVDAERVTAILARARERGRSHENAQPGVYYDFGEAERRGLERFRGAAVRHDLAIPGVKPEGWTCRSSDGPGAEPRESSLT